MSLCLLMNYIPINNYSLIFECFPVFLGWPSTKRRIQCHAPGCKHAASVEYQTSDPLTLYHWVSMLMIMSRGMWFPHVAFCVDSDKPVQPPFKLTNSKWCSVSSLTVIEYSSHKQWLWSDCAYAQAGLSLCSSHIPHCWKSHVKALI